MKAFTFQAHDKKGNRTKVSVFASNLYNAIINAKTKAKERNLTLLEV